MQEQTSRITLDLIARYALGQLTVLFYDLRKSPKTIILSPYSELGNRRNFKRGLEITLGVVGNGGGAGPGPGANVNEIHHCQ